MLMFKSKKILLPLIGVLLLASIGGNAYLYMQYTDAQELLVNPEIAAQKEIEEYTTRVGKLMDLPSDEEPTIATILDKDALADQAFFANAENGDKVLIYSAATKAILYRPSTNRIIEVAPIDITAEEPALETVEGEEAEATETEEVVVEETETEEETTEDSL